MKVKFIYFYEFFVFIIVLTMLVLNGFQCRYTVNWYSIVLVGMLMIPILLYVINNFKSERISIKAGAFEIDFGGLSLEKQMLIFLDGVIRQKQWTFYSNRQNEAELGQAFHILVDDLIKKDQKNFYIEIRKWLSSENENQMWFASEIIGYYQIGEFKNELKLKIEVLDINETWSSSQLNYLWAVSRFNKYKELNNFINKTKNISNTEWALFAYLQMIKEGHCNIKDFELFINEYSEQKEIELSLERYKKANEIIRKIKAEIALRNE
jgi:hypothetical protein